MSVTWNGPIFIKSSYKEDKTPEKYKDYELIFGVNAFSSLQDFTGSIYEDYSKETVLLLDSKTTIDYAVSITNTLASSDVPAAKNTLNIINTTVIPELKYFKTLNIDNSSVTSADILQEKYTEGATAESSKTNATGKVTVKNESNAELLCGYATVVVSDNSNVKDITGGVTHTYSYNYKSEKEVIKTTNAGKITVNDSYVGNISEYKTVTLQNALLDSAYSAVNWSSTTTADNNKITVSRNGSFKATDSTINGDVTNFNSVTLTNSMAIGNFNNYADDPSKSDSKSEQYNASGSFEVTVDKKADMEKTYFVGNYDEENRVNIKGYKSVTITGYTDKKGLVKVIDVNADITGGKRVEKDGVTTNSADGTFKATFAKIDGSINSYKSVTLTNSNVSGAVTGGKTEDSNTFSDGTFTFTLDKYAQNTTYDLSDITSFKTVKITGRDDAGISIGNITGGNNENGDFSAVGTVTISTEAAVKGNISGFKTVTLTDTEVSGNINCGSVKGSTVNLTDCEVSVIEKVQKLNLKKGMASIDAFTGTALDDTLTVNKNTILGVKDFIEFSAGGKDKLVVNGTLILSKDFKAINNCETISGSGEIAAVSSVMDKLGLTNTGKVKLLDLGATSANFVSSKYEAGDDTEKKAYEFDIEDKDFNEFSGWLSGGGENDGFKDLVDYVEVNKAATLGIFKEGTNEIASGISVLINGVAQDIAGFAVTEDAVIELRCDEGSNSIAYCIKEIVA